MSVHSSSNNDNSIITCATIVETTVANRDGGFIGLCQSLTKLLNTIEQKRSCILAFRVFFERKEERIA